MVSRIQHNKLLSGLSVHSDLSHSLSLTKRVSEHVLCTLTLYWAVQSAMLAVQLSIDRERGLRSMIDSWSW